MYARCIVILLTIWWQVGNNMQDPHVNVKWEEKITLELRTGL